MLQPRAGLGLDDQESREGFINPRPIIHFSCPLPSIRAFTPCHLRRTKRTCAVHPLHTHTKWPHTPPPRSNCFPHGITVHILLCSTSTTVTQHLSHPMINTMGLTFRTFSRQRVQPPASSDHLRKGIPGLATLQTSISAAAIQGRWLIPHNIGSPRSLRAITFILRMATFPRIHPTTKLVPPRPRFGQFG